MSYENSAKRIQPPFLNKPLWLAFVGALHKALDTQSARAQEAALAGIVEQAPEDNLANLGKDRALPRFSTEQIDKYRGRLARAFTFWRKGGTVNSLIEILGVAFPGFGWSIIEYRDSPPSFAPSTFWAQFDVFLTANELLEEWEVGEDHEIGEENLIVGVKGVDPFVFGFNELELIKQVILQTKPAYALCRNITIDIEGTEIVIPVQASKIP
jgi:hypothetical protein